MQSATINCTSTNEELANAKAASAQSHGTSTMNAGLAGVALRCAMPNLIELLSTMTRRYRAGSKKWMSTGARPS